MGDRRNPPTKKTYTRHSLTKTKERDLAKAFKDADKDGTGSLSVDEYMKVFREQGVNISQEAALVFFKDKDKDRDGRISYEEFVGRKTMSEKLWHLLDTNEDGFIRQNDVETAMNKYKKTMPMNVATGLLQEFEAKSAAGGGSTINYAQFCVVVNRFKNPGTSTFEAAVTEAAVGGGRRAATAGAGSSNAQAGLARQPRRAATAGPPRPAV